MDVALDGKKQVLGTLEKLGGKATTYQIWKKGILARPTVLKYLRALESEGIVRSSEERNGLRRHIMWEVLG